MMFVGRKIVASAYEFNGTLYVEIKAKPEGDVLTPREQMIAKLLVSGDSYKGIARTLGSSPATVRNQAHSIYTKLKVGSKTDLANALRGGGPPGV